MFYKVVLKNFKNFDFFEINFKEGKTKESAKKLILLYGENGVGKSSFVDAFQLLMNSMNSLINIRTFNKSIINEVEYNEEIAISLSDHSKRFHIDYLIKDLKRISSNEPMELVFYGYDQNRKSFEYSMVFDSSSIIKESLIVNKKSVFNIDENKKLQHSICDNREFSDKLEAYKNMYFGKHTLLSCVTYILEDFSQDYVIENVSDHLLGFVKEINLLDIFRPQTFRFDSYSYTYNDSLLPNLVRGVYRDDFLERLDNTKSILSKFFSSLYENIDGVEYDVADSTNGVKKYSLVFLERSSNGIIRVPFGLESTGTKKLVALFTYFYQVFSQNMTALIDEIDSGLSVSLLQRIVSSFDVTKFRGQLILTTHNLMLMKEIWKKNIYIMRRDTNYHVIAYSLDIFKREIQPNTDIVGKYLKNRFGGVAGYDGSLFDSLIIKSKKEM